MSVYYAITLQRVMGRLLQPAQVREWIRGSLLSRIQTGRWITLKNATKTDPDEFQPSATHIANCFTPSLASVLTISAPQMLLSLSLFSLLFAFGVYYGCIWTRNLDPAAGPHGSRNIVIIYIASATVCWLIYAISHLISNDDRRSEKDILLSYFACYIAKNPDTVRKWNTSTDTGRPEAIP
jgi:hypothetical protein